MSCWALCSNPYTFKQPVPQWFWGMLWWPQGGQAAHKEGIPFRVARAGHGHAPQEAVERAQDMGLWSEDILAMQFSTAGCQAPAPLA